MRIGASLRNTSWKLPDDEREDFNVVMGACLTLLGLVIGFSFSMAIGRYDQRKNLEEEEANAIGTEYVRADLLPAADGAKVRSLLKSYLDQRLLFYRSPNTDNLHQIDEATSKLQTDLWSAVTAPPETRTTAAGALTLSGMNDVLNSQGYTLAAWRNRIPVAAWILMEVMGVCSSLAIGYSYRHIHLKAFRIIIFPLLIAISFGLIADIDSPNGGVIRVRPENLESLSPSLRQR